MKIITSPWLHVRSLWLIERYEFIALTFRKVHRWRNWFHDIFVIIVIRFKPLTIDGTVLWIKCIRLISRLFGIKMRISLTYERSFSLLVVIIIKLLERRLWYKIINSMGLFHRANALFLFPLFVCLLYLIVIVIKSHIHGACGFKRILLIFRKKRALIDILDWVTDITVIHFGQLVQSIIISIQHVLLLQVF